MSTKTWISLGWALVFSVTGCSEKPKDNVPKPQAEAKREVERHPKYVSASDGLILRAKPTVKSKALLILPFRMRLNGIVRSGNCESIDGIAGCWVQFTSGKFDGWVFDGYLVDLPPMMTQVQYRRLSEQYCGGLSNFCECATKIEQGEMPKYPNITRSGDKLTIRLENGGETYLKDTTSAEEYYSKTRKYRFERRENDFYIFQVCCYEWSERQLVNGITGVTISTFGEQLFSPNGSYVLSFSDEPFSRNGIEVFSLSEQKPKRVFSSAPPGITMTSISWKSNEIIEIIDANSDTEKNRTIEMKNGKWKLK